MDSQASIRSDRASQGEAGDRSDPRAAVQRRRKQLRFNERRSARMIEAVLKAAMVNADEQEADMRRLYVHDARIDGGPYFRRWRPKDRGRAHPIAKRTSHITVTLAEV